MLPTPFACPKVLNSAKRKVNHQTNIMKAHSNLQKRKSSLIIDGNSAAFKKRRPRTGSYVDSLEGKQAENIFTGEKDEDNNEAGDNSNEEKDGGDDDVVDDPQEEGEYLLGDEVPTTAIEEEFHKGLLTKDADEKNTPSTRHFSHGCHLIQGEMNHGMEDYIFAQHRKLNGYDLGLYAIFDGHAGHDVAKYLQSHLFENILSEPDFWTNPVHAVKKACKATDDEILENIADSHGGSTAVAAIIINGVKLLVVNVGDSRAISCKDGLAKQLTVDHEPEKEKDLVESRGGFVSKKPGSVPRVDGQLAMTRAFGDGKLKEHITAEPDVMIQKIDGDTEFIILASDGLWKKDMGYAKPEKKRQFNARGSHNAGSEEESKILTPEQQILRVMTNQEACDCIRDVDDAQKASKKLVKEAKSLGSYDDISCIVVML